MALRGLILSLKEFNIAKDEDLEGFVMEDGLTELLDGLAQLGSPPASLEDASHRVEIINLDLWQADTKEKLDVILKLHQLSPEECLMIAATAQTLSMAEHTRIASIGYVKPHEKSQDLSQAQILVEGFEEVDFYFLERIYQRKNGIPWTVIETERCFLREMVLEDLDVLYPLYQGRDITRFMEGLYEKRETEEAYTKAYIENMYRFYGYGIWVIVEKNKGVLIGRAGLNHVELHGETSLEMGYMIGETYQNQGYATEVCLGVLAFAKEVSAFENVNCLIQKENTISLSLMEKLGFIWEEEIEIKNKPMQRYTKTLHF